MVPNSLQWRWIDRCVNRIDRRLLFAVHSGIRRRQAALIKLTVNHDCLRSFISRIKFTTNIEGGRGKNDGFRLKAEERGEGLCIWLDASDSLLLSHDAPSLTHKVFVGHFLTSPPPACFSLAVPFFPYRPLLRHLFFSLSVSPYPRLTSSPAPPSSPPLTSLPLCRL